jgi:hypothetical protein
VLFLVVLGGDFLSPLLVVFSVCFQELALGDLMGEIRVNPSSKLKSCRAILAIL